MSVMVEQDDYGTLINDVLDAEVMVRNPGTYRYLIRYRGVVMLSHHPVGVVLRRL